MKLGKIAVYFSLVTIILAGCSTAQTNNSTTSTLAATSTTYAVSTSTTEIKETTSASNSLTWENGIREIFEVQCSECHLSTPSGGFSITSYTRVLQGSNLGPIIIPGNPDESHLFYKLKFGGNHPGYMSKEQTDLVWEWVSSGAPE